MRTTRASIALAAALLLGLALTGCTSDSPATTSAGAPTPTTIRTGATTTSAPAAGSAISIKDFAFHPADLKVAVGAEVTVTNDDTTTHTWSAEDVTLWDSGDLAPGKSFKHTFVKAGTFTYHCHIHQTMKGTITVS